MFGVRAEQPVAEMEERAIVPLPFGGNGRMADGIGRGGFGAELGFHKRIVIPIRYSAAHGLVSAPQFLTCDKG